jgi:hypothetical protein
VPANAFKTIDDACRRGAPLDGLACDAVAPTGLERRGRLAITRFERLLVRRSVP